MEYTMYETNEGIIRVYRDAGYEYYVDVDNRYDMAFDTRAEFEDYLQRVHAVYIGVDHD